MDLGGLVCEMKEGRKYRQRNKGKDGWMDGKQYRQWKGGWVVGFVEEWIGRIDEWRKKG